MTSLLAQLQSALLGRYAIERELGAGGMATVYLAEDLKHHRKVALKVLRPELAAALGPGRFLREIEISARLTHPNILPLFDSGSLAQQEGGVHSRPYYVMPYIAGESLRDRLVREHQLPVDEALRIAREVAEALGYAHAQEIVHRDIKPENILLESGHAVVADFGIARAIEQAGGEKLTETGLAIGTPDYMSPEQSAGDPALDGRSDLYSLGCVLYEMLAGHPPFLGRTPQEVRARHALDPVPPLRAARATASDAVEAALQRALAKQPADRFASAAEFAAALAPVAGLRQAAAAPTEISAAVTARRFPIRVTLWGAALVVAVIGALLWSRQRNAAGLHRDLIAVAPFDVLDPRLDKLWREGMVDILSRTLDGAGSLRTVAPSLIIKRWAGRADAPSARTLGLRTGAELVVYGSLVSTGRDSVRATVSLLDTRSGHPLGEVERRAAGTDMDRLADSVAVGLLAELGRSRPVGYVRGSGLGGRSLPALKAFLQGEQLLRAERNDSALAAYRRAIELDSAFPQALRHAGWAAEFLDDTSYGSYYFAAARLNHGLSVRDSLLTTYDSVWGAMRAVRFRIGSPAHVRQLLATAAECARRYPEDPEAWWDLYAARGLPGVSRSNRQLLETLDRLISLDSTFLMAYDDAIGHALDLDGPARALVYLAALRRAKGGEPPSYDLRMMEAALGGNRPLFERLLDSASADELSNVVWWLHSWPDSDDLGDLVFRATRGGRNGQFLFRDSTRAGTFWGLHLLFRGALREACRDPAIMSQRLRPYLLTWCGVLHSLPTDSVRQMLADGWKAARRDPDATQSWWLWYWGLLWWADQRDTLMLDGIRSSISATVRRAGALSRQLPTEYFLAAVRAYGVLARGDSALALERFKTLPDSLCPACWTERLVRARLELATGSPLEALKTMEYWVGGIEGTSGANPDRVLWVLTRGEAAEQVGERALALKSYRFVVDAWQHGDSGVQPYVQQARAGLARLTAEPRR